MEFAYYIINMNKLDKQTHYVISRNMLILSNKYFFKNNTNHTFFFLFFIV